MSRSKPTLFTSLLGTFSAMGIPKAVNGLDSALYERNNAYIVKWFEAIRLYA
ncbi:uncharacterized protein G6M90_00g076360 [Metarhizium brunneum]|uniref:Uncharacterized protein n=1 Tax=Metarhizium brunneum TaxID=500148 RepID=A0A7D5Z2A9_9HYPO|nr:hypothetical protein G6M90_00g076360 [Metarhizium brunneum]